MDLDSTTFLNFLHDVTLKNLGVLIKTDWSVIVRFAAENTGRMQATKIHVHRDCSRYGVRELDERF